MMAEMVLVQKAVSKVFGDFVSKVVSDGVDVLKGAIKDADLNRKSYNQNLQTRLYQLVIDTVNKFTHNKYEKQDKLYDTAEIIIKGYISIKDNTDAVKSGLKMLVSGVNNDTCQEFLEALCGEICKDENSDLYKEIDMLWKKQESEYIHSEFEKCSQNGNEILEQLDNLKEVLDFLRKNMNSQEAHRTTYHEMSAENKAQYYADKWDKNVFLNNFDEEDERAGDRVNIKLRDIYLEELLPSYILNENKNLSYNLKKRLEKYIVDKKDSGMLLILGQPGIGKSTLITWIMANLVEKKDEIFVYQFASDLKQVNWQGKNILEEILATLNLESVELRNKALILDGFDEISISGDRERILNKLDQEVKARRSLGDFSLVITCRENYIDRIRLSINAYITLQAWNEHQIKSFCDIYEKKSSGNSESKFPDAKSDKILENKEIFGVPLILYMILALDVDIGKSSSIVDIYDQIFTLDTGSIYSRCIRNLEYGEEHRINEKAIKEKVHKISQKTAFWIFEHNSEKACIPHTEFKEICNNVIEETKEKAMDIQADVLIGNYFKPINHCEGTGTDELQFVHRSIYEYFVTVYFFDCIYEVKENKEIVDELKELLETGYLPRQILELIAEKLGGFLKKGRLSKQILEFIKCKFNNLKGLNQADITKRIFDIMLRNGMTYYTDKRNGNVIEQERNIFSNMLEVVGLWNLSLGELDKKIIIYLQCNREERLHLHGIKLGVKDIDMKMVNLSRANLGEADLNGADLSGADLNRADLSGADLNGANLSRADLNGADLSGANLDEANLSRADLNGADLSGANLGGANLGRTDLSGANLGRADLSGTNLSGADLNGADLSRAYLFGANLNGASLNGANLEESILDEKQVGILYKICDLSSSRVFLFETNEIMSYKEYHVKK